MFKQVIALGLLIAVTNGAFVCQYSQGYCISDDAGGLFHESFASACPRGECYDDNGNMMGPLRCTGGGLAADDGTCPGSEWVTSAVWDPIYGNNPLDAAARCRQTYNGTFDPTGGQAQWGCDIEAQDASGNLRGCQYEECCEPCTLGLAGGCTSGGCSGGATAGRCSSRRAGVCLNGNMVLSTGVDVNMEDCCGVDSVTNTVAGVAWTGGWDTLAGCQTGTNTGGYHYIGSIHGLEHFRNQVRSSFATETWCTTEPGTTWTPAAPPIDLDGTPYHNLCYDKTAAECRDWIAVNGIPAQDTGSWAPRAWDAYVTYAEGGTVDGSALAGDEEESDSPAAGLAAAAAVAAGAAAVLL